MSVWIWLAVFIAGLFIEGLSSSLTTIWAALSALIMVIICSLFSVSMPVQLLVFSVLTLVFLFLTRPLVVKRFPQKKEKTNSEALVGQEVIVVEKISQYEKGYVKTEGGVLWSAKSADGAEIETGMRCVVKEITGNTLSVEIAADNT